MFKSYRSLQPLVVFCFMLFASVLHAGEILDINDAWVAEAPPVAPVMGGYMKIENGTAKPISITRASCPDFETVEIHEMSMSGGMMKMQQIEQLVVPANGKVELKPGGYHLMLMMPVGPLAGGARVTVDASADDGRVFRFELPVERR